MILRRRPNQHGLLKMGGISLALHFVLAALLNLNPLPTISKIRPLAYTITLMPVALPEPEIQREPIPALKEETSKPVEKPKPPPEKLIEKPKKDDIVERVKKPMKKVEKPEEKKPSFKHLQEALEEVRKKVAIDEIRKKVAHRDRMEERPTMPPLNAPPITSSKTSSPLSLSRSESRLNEYYSMIWAKIKEEWTIPENLLKEMVDFETIIVLIIERDGKIQKSWYEKKSGNTLYDQMAMRAIKKAEPLPPIPKELSEKTLEIGIRFRPE